MRQSTRFQSRTAAASVRVFTLGAFALLAACGGNNDAANPAAVPITVPGSASQVEQQVGDASVIALAIQTSQLPAQVAAEQGIEQRDDLVMLRVSPRQGEIGNITTAPVQVRATVTDLRGAVSDIAMEEQVVAGLVDHVGTVQVTLPATLRFDVEVVSPQGETKTLQFSREFRAR